MPIRRKLAVVGSAVVLLAGLSVVLLIIRPWEDAALRGLGSARTGTPRPVRTFDGPADDPLERPVALLVHDGRVYVADAARGVIDVFSPGGHHFGAWGKGVLVTPVAVAVSPQSGELYVADRALEAIVVFGEDGSPKGRFAPEIPAAASWSTTPAALWSPIAMDFTPDGFLYVTEVRSRHRLLVFNPKGRFEAEAGVGAPASSAAADGSLLSFPTAVRIRGNEVWVTDSNNMRLRVFDLSGRLLRDVAAPRLPRGLAFAPGTDGAGTVLVADAMSHRITVWDAQSGRDMGVFGSEGPGESQLSYPNAVASGDGDLVFVADTGNARVSVWSWTGRSAGFGPEDLWLGLLALPLVPLLALPFVLRKPRYFVTADFVRALETADRFDVITWSRAVWECLPEDWGELQAHQREGGPLVPMFEAVVGSDADAKALRERYHLDEREAAVLSAARGASLLLTDDAALLRVADAAGITVCDSGTFAERFDAEQSRSRRGRRAQSTM